MLICSMEALSNIEYLPMLMGQIIGLLVRNVINGRSYTDGVLNESCSTHYMGEHTSQFGDVRMGLTLKTVIQLFCSLQVMMEGDITEYITMATRCERIHDDRRRI